VSKQGRFGKASVAAIVALSLCLGAAQDARATLGGDIASVATNEQNLGAVRQVQQLGVAERHDLTLPSGVVVHEYVSAGGVVYAITWRGPRMPNLRELLGPYFAELATRAPQAGHNRLSYTGKDLEIRSAGHRHSFGGRAWIPSLVPPGVSLDTLLN
jgi:hypothetical protein